MKLRTLLLWCFFYKFHLWQCVPHLVKTVKSSVMHITMPDTAISQVFLFADDIKLFKQIRNDSDQKIFQDDISKLQSWADDWLLKFHPDKCKILGVGKKELTHQYMTKDDHSLVALSRVQDEKDVGVTFDEDMTFRKDINTRANKANSIIGIIRRTYTYLHPQSFN